MSLENKLRVWTAKLYVYSPTRHLIRPLRWMQIACVRACVCLFFKITLATVSQDQSKVVVFCAPLLMRKSRPAGLNLLSWQLPHNQASSLQLNLLCPLCILHPQSSTPIPPFLCPKGCWLVTWFRLKNNSNPNPLRDEMARVLSWNVSNASSRLNADVRHVCDARMHTHSWRGIRHSCRIIAFIACSPIICFAGRLSGTRQSDGQKSTLRHNPRLHHVSAETLSHTLLWSLSVFHSLSPVDPECGSSSLEWKA